jgi:hypothetical protein
MGSNGCALVFCERVKIDMEALYRMNDQLIPGERRYRDWRAASTSRAVVHRISG